MRVARQDLQYAGGSFQFCAGQLGGTEAACCIAICNKVDYCLYRLWCSLASWWMLPTF